jgi:peptidylprolyl isomerase
MNNKILLAAFIFTLIVGCSTSKNGVEKGLYAEFNTNKGTITLQLAFDQTPNTVANFVSLAEGTNNQVDSTYLGKKYYDGLVFHRVIPVTPQQREAVVLDMLLRMRLLKP